MKTMRKSWSALAPLAAHKDWDVDGIADPAKRATAEKIDNKIRDSHQPVTASGKRGEKLIQADPKGLKQTHDRAKPPAAGK